MTGPVLLCFDGSDGARRAIAEAAGLLGGGTALVVHVWEPVSALMLRNPLIHSPGPLVEQAAELDSAGAEAAQRLADEGAALARSAGFDAEALCVRSNDGIWPHIVQLAEEQDARAVVLGPRKFSPVGSFLLGSVSSGVAHHCGRPVLVIPPADEHRPSGMGRARGL